MVELVVGADGYIGSHLIKMIPTAMGTTRGHAIYHHLDLLNPEVIPQAEIAYICAGVNGFQACEGNVLSYRTNVDGTLKVAREITKGGGFVVWISSCSVEWAHSAYSLQKSLVEIALQMIPQTAIVRAGRVVNQNVESLCKLMVEVGRGKKEGIHLWNTVDMPWRS